MSTSPAAAGSALGVTGMLPRCPGAPFAMHAVPHLRLGRALMLKSVSWKDTSWSLPRLEPGQATARVVDVSVRYIGAGTSTLAHTSSPARRLASSWCASLPCPTSSYRSMLQAAIRQQIDACTVLLVLMQESIKSKHPQLLYESKLYKILQGGCAHHIPRKHCLPWFVIRKYPRDLHKQDFCQNLASAKRIICFGMWSVFRSAWRTCTNT